MLKASGISNTGEKDLGLLVDQGLGQQLYSTVGALIIRIGFGGPLYYKYKTEPPK